MEWGLWDRNRAERVAVDVVFDVNLDGDLNVNLVATIDARSAAAR
jgi:hypothetical protein